MISCVLFCDCDFAWQVEFDYLFAFSNGMLLNLLWCVHTTMLCNTVFILEFCLFLVMCITGFHTIFHIFEILGLTFMSPMSKFKKIQILGAQVSWAPDGGASRPVWSIWMYRFASLNGSARRWIISSMEVSILLRGGVKGQILDTDWATFPW